jgi:hypothetical protein
MSQDPGLKEIHALREQAHQHLLAVERADDLPDALAAVKTARSTLEALLERMNAYSAAPDLPALRAPEWVRLHSALGAAVAAYPVGLIARAEQFVKGGPR